MQFLQSIKRGRPAVDWSISPTGKREDIPNISHSCQSIKRRFAAILLLLLRGDLTKDRKESINIYRGEENGI